ncbi:hypothetical protein A6E01_20715 (plasmid) [Vibrio breoganii]|uniref:Uncharacterized protein n=2 Tax=Vibrionaceae TaxID=641 RepID=A0AAN0XZM7_9VIBR|nr:hypothetical protein A6E01_20715 [Vibrio breoganii]PML19302.1 hypothetical protein BCT84_18685 [Vibrio breoganii]
MVVIERKDKEELKRIFGFDEEIELKVVGNSRNHPLVRLTGKTTSRAVLVKVANRSNSKWRKSRGSAIRRHISYITNRGILNGTIVYKKGTRSGGPKTKIGKAL